jgi:hypothetical protein
MALAAPLVPYAPELAPAALAPKVFAHVSEPLSAYVPERYRQTAE